MQLVLVVIIMPTLFKGEKWDLMPQVLELGSWQSNTDKNFGRFV